MTIDEAADKLAAEQALAMGDFYYFPLCRHFIKMALVVGMEHFTPDSEEIVCMNLDGAEIARFKSVRDAEDKLKVDRRNINHVIKGSYHSAGGFIWMLAKDKIQLQDDKIA